MAEPDDANVYDGEGQLEEGQNDDDDDNNNDNLVPSKHTTPWGSSTPGGPTPGGPEMDEESSDDDENDDDNNNNSRNNVDLCILCDITDSMNEWIVEVKNGIDRIVNELKNTFGIGKLRVSFIGYRDWNDDNNNLGEKRIEKIKFTSNIKKFESFIETVAAIGGGDAAEDVLGGIQNTINLSWKAPIRVVYHICDAPAHGTMYHDLYDEIQKQQHVPNDFMSFLDGISDDDDESESDEEEKDDEVIMMESNKKDNEDSIDKEREQQILRDELDKWPNKYPKDPKHEDLFLELKKKNIQYYIGTQTKFTDKMVGVFKEYCDSIDYNLSTMDLVNVTQFLPTLIEAVSDAIRIIAPPKERPPISLNLEELQKKKVNFKVHCGIDFGTAGSGFAYALPGKTEVYTDQNWNNSGKHVDVKTKTNILLDTKGNCIAFGDDATDKYTHTDTNDLFFERFKMALYEKQLIENDDDDEKKVDIDNNGDNKSFDKYRIDICEYLTATNGKQLASRKVLEEAIGFMKDHAMSNLREKVNKYLKIEEIQWILTVPAIWSDKAKSVMKRAAINAGMVDESIDNQLIIAYEPDCASLSIQHEINEKLRLMDKQQKKIKKQKLMAAQNVINNNNDDNDDNDDNNDDFEFDSFFNRGDKILLCDLGGGTADIACHEIDENEGIREISAPSGGAWGSTYVDENFLILLKEIFSKEWMDEFKKEEPSKYIELLNNFRDSKKTYKMNEKKKIKKKQYDTTYHNIALPFTFLDFMGEKAEEQQDDDDDHDDDDMVMVKKENQENDEDDDDDDDDDELEKIVKNFTKFDKKGLVRLNDEYFELSYTIWNYLFDQVIDKIINHCKKLLDLPEMTGCKYLCLAGGFSESKHLQNKMFINFGKKSKYEVMIFTPKRPILSVVDGAARMGLKPNFISARTIAKTYGIAVQKDLNEFKSIYPTALIPKNKISKRLVYKDKLQKQMISRHVVNDVFLPFVRKNKLIKNNDKPIIYWIEPADIKTNKISIKLYNSLEIDPMFVNEKEENKIEIELNNNNNNKPIPIIFIFNDTTIRVFVDIINDDGNNQIKEVNLNFDVL